MTSELLKDRHRVLVVDDDADVRESLARGLALSGFEVCSATDGTEAIAVYRAQAPDAIVLDMQMPRLDGIGVIMALRAFGSEVPICVLSARTDVADRIEGLEAGADDYVVKPFVFDELTARLRAVLRRARPAAGAEHQVVDVGPLRVDFAGRTVLVSGVEVALTRREYDLLSMLAANRGQVLTRQQLLESVWGYDFTIRTNVVDVFVAQLRRKLESGGQSRVLHTVRGVGYVLRTDVC